MNTRQTLTEADLARAMLAEARQIARDRGMMSLRAVNAWLDEHHQIRSGAEQAAALGITKQALQYRIRQLVEEGALVCTVPAAGGTPGAYRRRA